MTCCSSPEVVERGPGKVAHGVDIGQEDQDIAKVLERVTAGRVKECSSDHQEVQEDGCLDDVDVLILIGFGEDVHQQNTQSSKTHQELGSEREKEIN